MKNIFTYIILIAFASCSLLTPKVDPPSTYIAGSANELQISLQNIEESLTQYESMGAGTYKMKVTLLTPLLLEMRELTKPFTQEEIQKNIREIQEQLSKKHTCFEVTLRTIKDKKYASFEEWKARAFSSAEEKKLEYPLDWKQEALNSKPAILKLSSYYGASEQYENKGILCSETPIENIEKGIVLKFLPSFIQWPFDGTLDLEWTFIDPLNKNPKRIKERYRGW